MAAQVKALSIKRLAIIFYARGSSSDWESTRLKSVVSCVQIAPGAPSNLVNEVSLVDWCALAKRFATR